MANQKLKDAGIKTDSQIKLAIKEHDSGDDVYAIQGYKGLNLYIRGNKTTTFRHRFTSPVTGKRQNFTLGTYPVLTLEQARDMYRDNLVLISQHIDPIIHHKDAKNKRRSMPTFAEMAAEWVARQAESGG